MDQLAMQAQQANQAFSGIDHEQKSERSRQASWKEDLHYGLTAFSGWDVISKLVGRKRR